MIKKIISQYANNFRLRSYSRLTSCSCLFAHYLLVKILVSKCFFLLQVLHSQAASLKSFLPDEVNPATVVIDLLLPTERTRPLTIPWEYRTTILIDCIIWKMTSWSCIQHFKGKFNTFYAYTSIVSLVLLNQSYLCKTAWINSSTFYSQNCQDEQK